MRLFALPTRTLCLVLTLLSIACHREPDRSYRGTTQETTVLGSSSGQKGATSGKVIRIGYPGVGIGGRPFLGGTVAATVQGRRALDAEFARDGVEVVGR